MIDIKTKDISVSIDDKEILKSVSIDAKNGEFVGVIGPNGSGKTTFLKTIYRYLKPDYGDIFIDDININEFSIKESSKKISVLSQHNNYDFDFSVMEIVMLGRSPHKKTLESYSREDYEIANRALKIVDMADFKDRSFQTLSGGERQRVILARCLCQETGCIILDEPTNHLDIKFQINLMKAVKNLDITAISAIHDLNIAAMFCDKIYILKDGKVVDFGTPDDVITVENIKNVYEVDCEIIKKDNRINIIYKY